MPILSLYLYIHFKSKSFFIMQQKMRIWANMLLTFPYQEAMTPISSMCAQFWKLLGKPVPVTGFLLEFIKSNLGKIKAANYNVSLKLQLSHNSLTQKTSPNYKSLITKTRFFFLLFPSSHSLSLTHTHIYTQIHTDRHFLRSSRPCGLKIKYSSIPYFLILRIFRGTWVA